MESTSAPTRPKSEFEPRSRQGVGSRYSSIPETTTSKDERRASNQVRVNPASPEVISSLIFSLSSITDQSEELYDRLVPVQDKGVRPQSSRSTKRATIHYTPSTRGVSSVPSIPSLRKGEAVVTGKKLDEAGVAHAETVAQDIGEEKSNSSSSSLGKRAKSSAKPPPISVPNQAISSQEQYTPIILEDDEGGSNQTFGNVSVMPGRTESPSIKSADSGSRKLGLGRSSSRAKSTKDKIKELDEQRRKRLSQGKGRSPGTPRSPSSPQRSRSPALFSTDVVNTDGRASPAGAPLLQIPASPKPSFRSALDSLPEQPVPVSANDVPAVGPSNALPGKRRSVRPPGVGGGGFHIPPRGSSKRHSLDSLGTKRESYHHSDESPTRAPAREKPWAPIAESPTVAVERDETGTTRRIQELKAQKELRDRKEQTMLSKLQEPSRPVLGDIMPNGGVTHLEPSSSVHGFGHTHKRTSLDGTSQKRSSGHYFSPSSNSPRTSSPNPARTFSTIDIPVASSRPAAVFDSDVVSVTDSIDEAIGEYIDDARLSRKIYHPGHGRCVSFSDVGDPAGHVIICCVGMGTTRYVTAFYDELARTLGLRLITPERPGIGNSDPHTPGELDTPLGWPDDVRLVCQHLNISRFSLLAHSAGAIYALATALRMPSNIRGRVHILAPWIPPSQLVAIGLNQEPVPVAELPLIQRILRNIPEPLLEAATRMFNVSSITSSLGKSPYEVKRRRNTAPGSERKTRAEVAATLDEARDSAMPELNQTPDRSKDHANLPLRRSVSVLEMHHRQQQQQPYGAKTPSKRDSGTAITTTAAPPQPPPSSGLTEEERAAEYDARLTATIWQLATTNANPAVDLMVCLERKQEIGFRYEDITKPVVMHHGTKDSRVSVENVLWLGDKMRRCEVRVLEGEGHGLMASAGVMGNVLVEMAKDWEDWNAVVRGRK